MPAIRRVSFSSIEDFTMAQQFPNGTVFSVSTALATAIAISALTNADPAVATVTSPPSDGTIGVVTSGWPLLNQRVVRSANADSTTFELEGIDTSSTTDYPAGSGTGQFQAVSTWVTLSQVTNIAKSGGDQQFYQWQYAEDKSGTQQQRPTFKNAKSLTLTLDYDPALAWYDALDKADASKSAVVLRAVLPNGDALYYYVYPSFDADPSMDLNQNMHNTATFSLISRLTRYDAD
jgi:hypothetical protein